MAITTFYAGLLAIVYLALSYRVVQMRGHGGVNLGDGGNPAMLRRIRGHGNFAEYVPFILLMMALLESGGLPRLAIHGIGATLLVARLLHGYSLSYSDGFKFGRFYGTLLTFVLLLVCGVLCVWRALASI